MTSSDKLSRSERSLAYGYSSEQKSRCYFPVRYQLAVLLFFGTCASYMIKTNMSLTMVAMLNKTAIRSLENDCSIPTDSWCVNDTAPSTFEETSCPYPENSKLSNSTDKEDQPIEGTFIWKSEMQGVIVGSLLYGFASTNFLGGRLGDRLGPKWFIGGAVLLGSILTSLVPIVAGLGDWYLVALRVVTGMTQGCIFPCIAALFKRWVPVGEKSRFYTLSTSGAFVGMALCMPMVGYLCEQTAFANGWPSVFYTIGIFGAVWSLLWMILGHDDPSMHPRISPEERTYIMDNLPVVRSPEKNDFPWKAMLTSLPVWSLTFSWCVSSTIFWVRVTELPNYLDQVLHLPIEQNGNINAIANFCPLIFSVIGGFAADYLISNEKLKKATVRKMFECLALLGSCTFLMLVTVTGCDHPSTIALLTLSSGFLGLISSGSAVLSMDMAPTLSGTLFGIGNTFGSMVGFACPTVIGFILGIQVCVSKMAMVAQIDGKVLPPSIDFQKRFIVYFQVDNYVFAEKPIQARSTEHGTTFMDKWHYVFYFTSALGLLGSFVAVSFWKAEVQHWDPSSRLQDCENPSVQDDLKLVSNEQRPKF